MLSQMKTNTVGKLEGKRPKDLMSSSSLSGMSQLSNSSEETLEPLVHKPHKSETSLSTTKDKTPPHNEWLLNGPTGNKTSILRFRCSALATPPEEPPAKQLHMTYKIFQTETKLMNLLLQSHGLIEVPMNESEFNILWMGNHPKLDIFRNLMPHQKVNHFPRSYEITRKDRLYKNIEAMQRSKGLRNLDFIPQTFMLPTEYRELLRAHLRSRRPWIVKPKASSRGRGIYIVNSPEKILTDESVIVAQYINNPLLVDGHKCDLRLYVAVTNYDPLLIYLYEEGLVRFATVKYDGGDEYVWNPCMHLCNYSINKFHVDYVKSEDPDAEDVGHKWTLSALLRHLRSIGQDTELLMQRVEDIIIKSILATASDIVSGIKQFVKHPETCFELFGFDILIDDTLKPWLLEVNLTPSLGCDSPLDVRLKSALIADLLTLVGVSAVDPVLRPQTTHMNRSTVISTKRTASCRRVHSAETLSQRKKNVSKSNINKSGLSSEQQRIVASAKAQFERRGGFVRIFPSPKSWEMYSQDLDPTTGIPVVSDPLGPGRAQHVNTNHNLMLHEQLFPAASRTTGFIIPEVTLDRLSRYERYERALVKGHKQSLDRGDSKENMDIDKHKYKSQVLQAMHDGNKLSPGEARKAFGLYLGHILRKISQQNADPACCDLVIKFLQQYATNLTPFFFKLQSSKLSDKDRAAITAKQLSDFLHLYNRETDLYADTVDRPRTVPNRLFQKFLAAANEEDLDDILILQTRLYKCAHSFLRRSGFAGSLPGPNLLGSLPHITSRVYSNAANSEQCKCNQSTTRPTKALHKWLRDS